VSEKSSLRLLVYLSTTFESAPDVRHQKSKIMEVKAEENVKNKSDQNAIKVLNVIARKKFLFKSEQKKA
jgi:hypothetical protein